MMIMMMTMIKSIKEVFKNDLHCGLDYFTFCVVILALLVIMPFVFLGSYIYKLFDYIRGVKSGNTIVNNG